MFLIRKGEQPRPVCAGCKRVGEAGVTVPSGQVHVCAACRQQCEENRKRFEREFADVLSKPRRAM